MGFDESAIDVLCLPVCAKEEDRMKLKNKTNTVFMFLIYCKSKPLKQVGEIMNISFEPVRPEQDKMTWHER
jgi:hypothetical protein